MVDWLAVILAEISPSRFLWPHQRSLSPLVAISQLRSLWPLAEARGWKPLTPPVEALWWWWRSLLRPPALRKGRGRSSCCSSTSCSARMSSTGSLRQLSWPRINLKCAPVCTELSTDSTEVEATLYCIEPLYNIWIGKMLELVLSSWLICITLNCIANGLTVVNVA